MTAKLFSFKATILFIGILLISQGISEAIEKGGPPIVIKKDIIRGIELLYSWEFDRAEKLFQKVIAEQPKDPAGYFYLSMVTWSRLVSGFWFPENQRQYGKRIDRTILVAKKKISDEEADSFTYFYLGGALGYKGRFKMMQRKWYSSFFLALDAIEALKTSLRMDPDNRDVLFGLGIFDYYTARLSGVAKFLSFLLLRKGNKEEGLRKMHVAANEAAYSRIEAKSLLIHIYLFMEGDHHKALPLAEELAERFKKVPPYKFLQGVAYIRLGMDLEHRRVVDFLKKGSLKQDSRKKALLWINRSLYLESSYYLFHRQNERARSKLESILSHADEEGDPFMIGWPLLKIGMSHDLDSEREKALTYYRRILKLKNGAGAQFLARKYIDRAAKEGDPFLGY